MKLKDLFETPILIDAFSEYTQDQIDLAVAYFNDAVVVEKIELEYELLEKEKQYALSKDGNVLGFARTQIVEYFNVKYLKVNMIVVLPQHRNKKIGQILLHGIKEVVDLPLICDDVISGNGLKLFISVSKNKSIFSMKSLDKRDGKITDFKDGDEKNSKIALIVENKTTGLFRENMYVGSNDRMYIKFL